MKICTVLLATALAAASGFSNAEEDITKGFKFTTGIGAMYLKKGDVTEAIADNGFVRVKASEKSKLGLWFTANTFTVNWTSVGIAAGPFLGVQLGGDNNKIVNSFALGLGFASTTSSKDSAPLVFNIGWATTSRRSLLPPYADGAPLPTGSSQPVLTSSTTNGPLLLVSYRFGSTN
jgi:hypothetical protein